MLISSLKFETRVLKVCKVKMGQTVAKINELLKGEDRSNLQESKGMLHDITGDEADLQINGHDTVGGDLLDCTPKTPPNVIKLKCDPRSPTDFDRTPIKIPLDVGDRKEKAFMQESY